MGRSSLPSLLTLYSSVFNVFIPSCLHQFQFFPNSFSFTVFCDLWCPEPISFCFFRRMFPGLKLKLSGLNPSLRYILLLDIVPVDNSRYRFQGGGWQAVGAAEARLPDRVFIHPDSPATGAHWQSRTMSFHYAKLINNTLDTQGHVRTAHEQA